MATNWNQLLPIEPEIKEIYKNTNKVALLKIFCLQNIVTFYKLHSLTLNGFIIIIN